MTRRGTTGLRLHVFFKHAHLTAVFPSQGADPDNSTPLYSIDAYETRLDSPAVPLVATYGTYGLGADLTPLVWPKLTQIFTGGDSKVQEHFDRPECKIVDHVSRIPRDWPSGFSGGQPGRPVGSW